MSAALRYSLLTVIFALVVCAIAALHLGAAADGTKMRDLLAHSLQDGSRGIQCPLATADEKRELACLRLRPAPGNRCVQQLNASRGCQGGQFCNPGGAHSA